MARKVFCGGILITLLVLGFILNSCNPEPGGDTKSDNAVLISIAGQIITLSEGDGTLEAPKIASIDVLNSKEVISAGDVEISAKANMAMYSNNTFSAQETDFTLNVGIAVNIYIKVTAEDGTTVMYYLVTTTRSLPESIGKTLTITGINLTGTVTALLDENGGPNIATTYIAFGQETIISQAVTFQLKAQDNTNWTDSGSYLVYLIQEAGEYKYWIVDDPPGGDPEKVSFTSNNTEIAWSRFRGFNY